MRRVEKMVRRGQVPDRRPTRVLVVDDNEHAAELLGAHLGLLGFEVRTTFDGPSALDLAGGFSPDAAVLDIGLPGMDGYEIARRLRSSDRRTPVLIALTGWGQPEDKQRAAEAGFDHHFRSSGRRW